MKCRTFLWHILFLYALMCVLVSYHFCFVHLVYLMGCVICHQLLFTSAKKTIKLALGV